MPRLALAVVVGALGVVASLVVQRALSGPVDVGVVPAAGAPVPLFAGIALAVFHGAGLAVTVGLGMDAAVARRWIDRVVWAWPLIMIVLAFGLLW